MTDAEPVEPSKWLVRFDTVPLFSVLLGSALEGGVV